MIQLSKLSRGLVILVVIFIFVGLTACREQPPEVSVTPHQVIIAFACRDHERTYYEQLAEAFHKTHPSITVQIVSSDAVTGGDWDNGLRKLAAATDTFAFWRAPEPEEFRQGFLHDLQPFIETDENFQPDDFYPGLLELFRWGGNTWGLPAQIQPILVFYDKAAFDAAGLPYPQPGWTFEAFEAAARDLTVRQGGEITRYGLVVIPGDAAAALVLARAKGWAEGETALPTPILDSQTVADAAHWFVNLAHVQGAMPDPSQFEKGQTPFDLVRDGKAAMWIDHLSADNLATYRNLYDLGIAPLPEGTAIPEWVWASGYMMSASTTQPQASWQWLSFLTHQHVGKEKELPPARRTVAAAIGYWDELNEEQAVAYRYILESPKVSLPPGMVEGLAEALDAVLKEKQSVEETLAEAQERVITALNISVAQATPQPVTTAEPPETTEVSITYCTIAYPLYRYHELAAAFHELHPEITVSVVRPEDFSFEYRAEACDCLDYFIIGQFHRSEERELLLNLQPLVDADPVFPDDFYPGLLDTCRWEDELWALPAYVDFKVVFYNKDLFDKADVAYPQPGWNLDDFLEKAVLLTGGEGRDKVYGYMPLLSGMYDFDFFVEQKGGYEKYGEVEAITGLAPLDASAVVNAVRWYTDLALVYGVMPRFRIADEFSRGREITERRYGLIADGRVAMWTDYPIHTHGPPLGFQVGMAPLPLEHGPMRLHRIVGYMISAHASHPEACWEWLKFLIGQPEALRGAPTRQSFLEKPQFLEQVEGDALATYLFNLEHIDPVPWRGNTWLHQAFDAIMDGTSVEEAVGEALSKDSAFHACLDRSSELQEEEHIRACREEVEQ